MSLSTAPSWCQGGKRQRISYGGKEIGNGWQSRRSGIQLDYVRVGDIRIKMRARSMQKEIQESGGLSH
jgi:hypothetical protein